MEKNDSSGHINLDFQRLGRIGFDEAVLCEQKTLSHLTEILDSMNLRKASILLTRLGQQQFERLPSNHRERIDYEPVSRTGYYGTIDPPTRDARIAVVTAGTSDTQVAREAVRTLQYYGEVCLEIADAGVAGLWRLLDRIEEIRKMPMVIVVAGMDAALPSVVGGLVPGLVIAVPTSTGYGVARSGETALHAMLTSCAPGVPVVNIDNGYGAACAALRALNARC